MEFAPGFNVITGETGAGKSIIMGAVALLLGERAEKSIIRNGADKCEICAGLNLSGPVLNVVNANLANTGIEQCTNGELLIKRRITLSSSRNFINDTPVTLQTLKQLGDMLIDVHGPHEHQSLIRPSVQLKILDEFGKTVKEREKTANLAEKLKECDNRLTELEKNIPSPIEAEHLKSIISEIESAEIDLDMDGEINERHRIASHSRDILAFSSKASLILNESEESVINILSDLRHELDSLTKLKIPESAGFIEQCNAIIDSTRELAFDIDRFVSNIDINEAEFIMMEERISKLQTLKRKYGPSLEDVLNSAKEASEKLEMFENHAYLLESLKGERANAYGELCKACAELTQKRKNESAKFAKRVTCELRKLGFLKAEFSVNFTEISPGPNGADSVDFIFSANPGEDQKPLKKVASSGEISRVMLALKTVIAESDSVPILIFDEIDVNIGGETAVTVGEELRKLGTSHQLICISHLPQVAAAAQTHFKVAKETKGNRTFTHIAKLSSKERKNEITRMLGGGKAAKSHAEELLSVH